MSCGTCTNYSCILVRASIYHAMSYRCPQYRRNFCISFSCFSSCIMSSPPVQSLQDRRRTRSQAMSIPFSGSVPCCDDFPAEFHVPSRRSVRQRLSAQPTADRGGFPTGFHMPSKRSVRRRTPAQPIAGRLESGIAIATQPCRKHKASIITTSREDLSASMDSPSSSRAVPATSQSHRHIR